MNTSVCQLQRSPVNAPQLPQGFMLLSPKPNIKSLLILGLVESAQYLLLSHRNKYQVISWEFAPQKLNPWVPKDECVSFCCVWEPEVEPGLLTSCQPPWHTQNGLCRGSQSPGDIPSSVRVPTGNFKLDYWMHRS